MKRSILVLSMFLASVHLSAKVWQVGPNRIYTKPSQVAGLVASGDSVFIDAGTYPTDVAVWNASNLLIRGIGGGYAHMDAQGANAQGKAIWVMKGASCIIENIEFSGCKVPDQNGAGIRQEGLHLTMRNCYFHHNENGILTNNDGLSDCLFESCEFAYNGYGDGQSHNVYVGHVKSLTMRYCYSHHSKVGHLVKSRAEKTELYYNRFTGEGEDGSYEVDLPNGGVAILVGNVIEQTATSQNGGIIAFGLEGATNAEQQLGMAHNTIWNRRNNGRFVHVGAQTYTVVLKNNLWLGGGTVFTGSTVNQDTVNNLFFADTAAAQLLDLANYNFRPLPTSPCHNAAVFLGQNLQPTHQYVHPLASQTRGLEGMKFDIGAYEYSPLSATAQLIDIEQLVLYPNPVKQVLTLDAASLPQSVLTLSVFDFSGHLILDDRPKSSTIEVQSLPTGMYVLRAFDKHGRVVAEGKFVKE